MKTSKYFLAISLFCLGLCFEAMGHSTLQTSYLNRENHEVGEGIEVIDPFHGQDAGPVGAEYFKVNRLTNVTLIYGREDRSDVAGEFWWYRVGYELFNEGEATPIATGVLTISHEDGGGDYQSLQQHLATSGHVQIRITSIEASIDDFQNIITDPVLIADVVPNDVRLELQIESERYDYLEELAAPSVTDNYDLFQHNLHLVWSFVPGSEKFEVEWAFVDIESTTNLSEEEIFANAVRVEVEGQEYNVSATYPKGYLHYRVRGVGRFIRNVPNDDFSRIKYSAWSSSNSFLLNGFEANRNWQYTATFAEEGKHKKVISYFDDALKNRQTQTNLSTEETTLVATSHYDVEGRPTLNILPAPALGDNDLFYKIQFNRAEPRFGGQEVGYNRDHFDRSSTACAPTLPAPVSSTASPNFGGTGHYFSPNHLSNSDATGIHRDYIPNANNYPITQMRYLNDGTGRVAAQSGVGSFYQLGNDRETKYYYDDPSNFQLHRLFGSNVGDAKYYKRNLVEDANGQLSVSYLDAAGRVVATALAGNFPTNTLPLSSITADPVDITENLMDNNIITADKKRSISRSKIMNETENTDANFTYDFNGKNEWLIFDGNHACISCDYQLRIEVYDPCNNPVVLLETDTDILNPQHRGSSDTRIVRHIFGPDNCNNSLYEPFPTNGKQTFKINMDQVGLYTVVKELIVIDPAISDYLDFVTLPDPGTPVLSELSCYVTCDDCSQSTGSRGNGSKGSASRSAPCDRPDPIICETMVTDYLNESSTSCNSIYFQIINQVSPGGCKFNEGLWWQGHSDFGSLEFEMFDTDGNIELILGANLSSNQLDLLDNPLDWRDQWGEQLATIHPEYCRYVLCVNSEASRLFDLTLSNAENWGEVDPSLAGDGQTIGVSKITELINLDPMFDPGLGFYPNIENVNLAIPLSQSDINKIIAALIGSTCSTDFPSVGVCNGGTSSADIAVSLRVKFGHVLTNYGPIAENTPLVDVATYVSGIFNDNDYSFDLDGNGTIDNETFRFQLFKAIYLGEKERLRRAIRNIWCPIPNGNCAITKDTDLFDISFPEDNDPSTTGQEGADKLNENINTNCDAIRPVRVDQWIATVENLSECSQLTPSELDAIKDHFDDYLIEACGVDNPLAYLITEDIPDPLTGHLLAASTIMGQTCWDFFVAKQAVAYQNVYENVLDPVGNPVTFPDENGVDVIVATPKPDMKIVTYEDYYNWCREQLLIEGLYEEHQLWQQQVDELLTQFLKQRKCLEGINEVFYVEYESREHHYTLYYYDQAGNLVQTVPPIGVDPLSSAAFDDKGNWDGTSEPQHTQLTKYQYNTLGQVVRQNSPDGGETYFKYDYAQRLRVSQNAIQAPEDPLNANASQDYSFTSYDREGRIVKVGELKNVQVKFGDITSAQLNDFDFPTASQGDYTDVVYTRYNNVSTTDPNIDQENLRGRVSMSYNEFQTTRYSYDPHGNVKALQHQINQMENHKALTEYDYDLISGNVKEVAYQAGEIDAFYHQYEYDADNRLTYVHSSDDGVLWEEDARYFYYLHGPLARVEVGEDKIQGLDYYYTLQGWIKGVNLPSLNSEEPGKDGLSNPTNLHQFFAKDEMAYTLGYHEFDYRAIDPSRNQGALNPAAWTGFGFDVPANDGVVGLFNGNIGWMMTDLQHFEEQDGTGTRLMAYRYDQLHRIKQANSYTKTGEGTDTEGNITFTLAKDNHFDARYSYDANGNLQSLTRNAFVNNAVEQIDNLSYHYNSTNGLPNQLQQVSDGIAGNLGVADQVDADNYTYDRIGNLVKDKQGDISTIEWNVFGKVKFLKYGDGHYVRFTYDPAGNRLSKSIEIGPENNTTTFYVRDASGNVMSIYEKEETFAGPVIQQKEVPLYGSSRIGLQKFFDRDLSATPDTLDYYRQRGSKYFEFSNHLGNVLAVLSDQKVGMTNLPDAAAADYYAAAVVSANDYYPFGMQMLGRTHSSPSYRYGFNGKEKDENGEWGSLTHYDYGFRIYNPGIGRFLSVDPLTRSYPMLTPYQFASNTPIRGIDVDGLEIKYVTHTIAWNQDGSHKILSTDVEIEQDVTFPGLDGSAYALTFTEYVDEEGDLIDNAVLAEQVTADGLPPSARYDNTVDVNDLKQQEDWEYIKNGEKGNSISRYADLVERDYSAPDNEDLISTVEKLLTLIDRKSILKRQSPVVQNPDLIPLKKGGKTAGRSKRKRLSKILQELETRPSKPFENRGKKLPTHSGGKKITYREYDYNSAPTSSQRSNGANRGKKRVVAGSDGSAYYTNDHYKSFEKIK